MFTDTALARRIEGGEALNAAGCGESIPVGGGFASFAGIGSPLTHAIGLGLNGPVSPAEFDLMESFFHARGAPVNLDYCPHADFSLLELLAHRHYRIVEANNVLVAPIAGAPDSRVRIAAPDERDAWNRIMIEGFLGRKDVNPVELEVGRILFGLDGATAWFGAADGQLASAGAMNVRHKLALLFADATLSEFRGRGLHLAVIRARLHHAASLGCDLATASTLPGSISQRNFERAGFRVAYTKLNMQRDWS